MTAITIRALMKIPRYSTFINPRQQYNNSEDFIEDE